MKTQIRGPKSLIDPNLYLDTSKQSLGITKSDQNKILYPSNNSNTALSIKKGKIKTVQTSNFTKSLNLAQNSEIQRKIKRDLENVEETLELETQVRKKVKCMNSYKKDEKQQTEFGFGLILKELQSQEDNYFNLQIENSSLHKNDYYNQNKSIYFPDSNLPNLLVKKNELLIRTIEIMSNKNEKITIPIHEGLYKSNTSQKNQFILQKFPQIPNLCDFKMKNQYSQSIQFIKQYKSGYTPIQMQKKNNQEIEEENKDVNQSPAKNCNKDKSRNHFIRKQQSTLSLPRTCGVSYIKPSESLITQKPPFEPLPPLIFQGSTSCFIGSNQQTIYALDSTKKDLINRFNFSLQSSWLPFILSNQHQMRDLLLGKKTQNAKVGFVHGIQNLWPLYTEGSFILIFIGPQRLLKESDVWQALQNQRSYFKIGILSKKSTSGKKAFLKSIKSENSENLSVTCIQTNQNQIKGQSSNFLNEQKKYLSQMQQNYVSNQEEEKKISSTFEILEQQLKENRTVITMSLRLQIYVEEMDWKQRFTRQNKQILNQLIVNLKERLEKNSIRIICQRLQLSKENTVDLFGRSFQFIRICNDYKRQIGSSLELTQNQKEKEKINKCDIVSLLQKSGENFYLSQEEKQFIQSNTTACPPSHFIGSICSSQVWKKYLKFPLYYISTRDSFAFDLIEKKTILRRSNGRQYTKIDYYFYPDNVPANFGSEYRKLFPQLDVGVTAYHGFYTDQQLKQFQKNTFQMEQQAFKNKFLQMTVQPSIVSTKIKRTKFFFGYRYMWTRSQLSEPCSYVGAGVRKDVTSPPEWTKTIQDEMVKENLLQKDFVNSIAINVYHDGKQGLAQHFDDAVRFKQPIYTLRLFSDARLSFGSQFYGFCNGAFIIPLPRGCILVMHQNSYAANGVKHCVRPCDMTGKSAALILRQIHIQVVTQAHKYDELIDFPAWLSTLSQSQNSVTFAEQKRLEAQQIVKVKII